ncbi:hypothetical protein CFC21_091448 [Triticum aestivum]|uniref:F-box domain-containing protein n=2 Tax=Triticum aestivum TaxID=4565 RepID=A0A3B6QD70_WHEAT|nr:hypothetical protein CFC21_091448 [Triticum aestivum]
MSTGDIAGVEHVMDCCLPASPVSPAAHLSAAASSSSDGEDRICALPDTLLRNVVSRLPVKDAARTGALSHRWRGLWRATPLALDDSHLLPSPVPAAALVSRVLASHPGPFRAVRIAEIPIDESNEEALLPEWLRHLANKGVEELTLVNRPYSFDEPVQLPATLLRCGASLRRLYLGVWLFPFTTGLPRGPDVFPHLQELGLCHGITEERDLDYVLSCSPKLETLALISNYGYPDRVRIGSRSLRCLLLWHSLADEVAAVSAPNLQRLIIYCTHPTEDRPCSPARRARQHHHQDWGDKHSGSKRQVVSSEGPFQSAQRSQNFAVFLEMLSWSRDLTHHGFRQRHRPLR